MSQPDAEPLAPAPQLPAPAPKPVPPMEAGAVCWLKSGSPRLTVMRVTPDMEDKTDRDRTVDVVWNYQGQMFEKTFPLLALTTVRPF